jgi:2-keto-4-pentenoate hydratase/2-oxohepta-3-ene-1,7-dioic acid hydratase in catechol pathway
MRLTTVRSGDSEKGCISTSSGFIPIESINRQLDRNWPCDIQTLIRTGKLRELKDWYASGGQRESETLNGQALHRDKVTLCPLYRHPPKIWGIGLNYKEHASDLSEKVPVMAPASFMKPDTTIIGHGDTIKIPRQSEKTTAEAELGVIIGERCKDVEQKDWLSVIAGFTCIIDMTAEDILRQNPRYLTMSKSFDTFFSFGTQLVTSDEIEDVFQLRVSTIINGRTHAENVVSNMTFPPDFLVSFHSRIMTLLPGDIISTGTPGAVPIQDGDLVACRITGFEPLENPVKDLKRMSG